jgi:hypothetical protein
MPYFWKTKILLCKIEATYGIDPTPLAVGGMLAKDVSLVPMDGSEATRDLETGYMGNQGSLPKELQMKLSYKVELVGSGAKGTLPEWGRLLRACGCAEVVVASTSVTYNPISPPNLDSITHYLWIGDTLYKLVGGRGDATLRYPAQGIPYLDVEFTSLFAVPVEATRVFPNNNTFQKPELVSSAKTTFTINGVALKLREAMLKFNNKIEGRFLVGSESIEIIDRTEQFSCKVEATPVATFNPFSLAQAATQVPIILTHGTATGLRTTLSMPTSQILRLKGLENNQGIKEWPIEASPIATLAGNNQWTLAVT